jgi:hypothetical protein
LFFEGEEERKWILKSWRRWRENGGNFEIVNWGNFEIESK